MLQCLGSLVLLSFAMFGSGSIESLTAENFAIVQFDSRPMSNYWQAAAEWNQQYCQRHGHQFLYYNLDGDCHYKDEPLASAWCKVKAMINAMEDHPTAHVFYYMDSDAVIDMAFEKLSLKDITLNMKEKLNWNPDEKPIIFNQDGPCWWCRLIIKIGYTMCLNAGTVVWYRHALSEKILREWWDSSMDSYETNPIKRRFRLKWPWEQDRQMAVYNRSSQHIQVASQPERIFMQAKAGIVNGWCLSHLPDAECYISHYCANAKQKQEMRHIYSISNAT
jgi:hypothetical protein